MPAARFVAGASEVARELLGCLAEASRSDSYLAAIAGDGRHCHGYGYVAEKDDPRRWRYYEPVLVESEGLAGYVSSTVRDLLRGRRPGLRFTDGRDAFLAVLNPGRLEMHELF